MNGKNEIDIDKLLEEIRKDRKESFDDIYNRAKNRISPNNKEIETVNVNEKTEEDIIAEIFDIGDNISKSDKEEKNTDSESEETSQEEKATENKEDTEKDEDGLSTENDNEENKSGNLSFKKLYEEKKDVDDSQTRIFNKLKDEINLADDGHTKIKVDEKNGEEKFEKEFKESRKEKIESFRLFTESLTDNSVYNEEQQENSNAADMAKIKKGEDIFKAVEDVRKPKKENPKRTEIRKKRNSRVYEKIDVRRVKIALEETATKNKVRLIVSLISFVLFAAVEIVKGLYIGGKLPIPASIMTEKSFIFVLIFTAVSILTLAVTIDMFITRLKKSEKFTLNNETFLLLICFCNIINSVVQIISREEITKSTLFFGLPVSFILILNIISDDKENKMILKNLVTLAKNDKLLGIYALGKEADKIAAGISNYEEPVILCSSEVEVPDSFMDSSTIKDKQNNFMKFAVMGMLLLSLACAIIAKITYGTWTSFSTAFMSAILVISPAYLSYVLVTLLSDTNEKLNRNGCEILGYEAVEFMDDTDAIVLDTAEIFSGEISKFHLINPNSPINTVHAFEIACAVISESGGILKREALGLIEEQNLKMPEVESLEYEEKLGLSCWVEDKRVLVGTRQMMIEHALEVPKEYTEAPYLNEGKNIFYLAIDSVVTAMFCAEYFIGKTAKSQLEKIYGTGIILMLMSTDPHIDEAFVSRSIGVDASSVKTVNPTGIETIRKSIDKTAKQKRTGLIFKGNIIGLLRVINAAFRLYDVQSLTMLVQGISMVFGFIISAVLNIVATSFVISPLMIIGYHLLWMILSLIMTRKK